MNSLFLLIPLALVFVAIAIKIFFWAVDDGQFDDLDMPAHSILFEQNESTKKKANSTVNHKSNS